jgi:short-subunit dehydrogenase
MQYALIAGGSKGIGLAIAHALAKRHFNLVLVARHRDKLEEAKQLLETKYKITVLIFQTDLTKTEAADEVVSFCMANNLPVNMLCNVAGIGGANDYLSIPLTDTRYMIHLNVESVTALTHQMLPVLKNNNPAYILNVASMAGFAPIPVKNIYSATKSAVIFFSRALRSQLKNTNISVSCLCPGPVFTKPEIKNDTIEKMGWFGKQMAVPPAKVGEIAVHHTLKKGFIIVPGLLPKIISFFVRVLPNKLLVYIYERMIEKSS